MISTQYIKLNMTPSGVLPVLYCSQYDIGRPLGLVVYNDSVPVDLDTYTATIEATRTDRTPITAAVTTDDNIGVFVTTAEMTNKKDKYLAKLVLVDSSTNRVASLAFVMVITPATMDENAEPIQEDRSLYQQYTVAVQALIGELRTDVVDLQEQKVQRYDTVADMKADTNLKTGMYVRTGGYYAVDDSGGALYRINSSAPSTHYETLANGLRAALIHAGSVKPEQYGAIGVADASAIITKCVSDAVALNLPIISHVDLSIGSSIALNAAGIRFHCYGTLTYTGTDYAIKCQYPRQDVSVFAIIAANGGGIAIDTSLYNVQYVDVHVKTMTCKKSCYKCITSASHWVTYTKAAGDLWTSSDDYPCVDVEVGTGGSFIGECQFIGMNTQGLNGFKIIGASVSAVRLIRVSVEGIYGTGFIVDSAKTIDIIDPRYAELQSAGNTVLKLIGTASVRFTGNYDVRIDKIDLSDTTTIGRRLYVQAPIFSESNAHIANGIIVRSDVEIFVGPKLALGQYSGATVDVKSHNNSGYVQTIQFSGSVDTVVNLSPFQNGETFPYLTFIIPGAKTYTIKDAGGTTIATINSGYGTYMMFFTGKDAVVIKKQ